MKPIPRIDKSVKEIRSLAKLLTTGASALARQIGRDILSECQEIEDAADEIDALMEEGMQSVTEARAALDHRGQP